MKRQFASFLAVPFLLLTPYLHAQDQTGGSSGQSGSVDCSDPLQADSPLCSSSAPALPAGTSPTGSWPGQTGLSGFPGAGGSTGNTNLQSPYYTDNENFARQYSSRYPLQRYIPPEPLTEFQKFVASTTGQILPIFGADLFRRVPSTFAPLDQTPVPPDYTMGPGDELRIHVWGQINFRADVRVDRSGDIYLPQVGQVHVAGMPFSDLDEHLRQAVGRIYHNFDLTADVGQIRAIQVYLAGEARRPGVYTVSSLSTLVDALFASGGPSTSGSLRHIELRRSGKTVTDFDLYALLVRGDKSGDVSLQSGDVIFIPPAGPQAAITGSVRMPGIYEMRTGETLADAVADAGDVSTVAEQTRVSIERIDSHRDRQAMEVTFNKDGLATKIESGDLVRVFSIVPQYQKTVSLRGNIANPGRFAWRAGMRVSDLIPDKDSLLTRDYWWKRAQLGLPAPEFEPFEGFSRLRQPNTPIEIPRRRLLNQQNTSPYANPRTTLQSGSVGALEGDQGSSLSPDQQYQQYSPDQQYPSDQIDQSNQQDLQDQLDQQGQGLTPGIPGIGQPGGGTDTTRTQSQYSRANASMAALAAERAEARARAAQPNRTRIGAIAPEIDWSYAVIQRLDPQTLKTVLVPFDLGRLVLQHDASQDLALMPGDVVTILSQADIRVPLTQQTKYVRLDGEFVHSGVYTVAPGESLRDLVKRAGGLTPNAYLYGSEFTRESTRQVQQSRLNEYIQSLALQMQRGNLSLASSPAASAQDLASSASAQTSERQLLNRLRQMRATGRIVLEFRPGSHNLDAVPALPLEDGDRFVVPSVPASINVVGAVYNQSSFLFETGRRAGIYLRMAGGPNRDADQKHIFIIRADGSVISRAATSGLWGNEFDNLRMNPGDTIVVPEKSFSFSGLRGFLDYSQIFSQFAFGAAAMSLVLP